MAGPVAELCMASSEDDSVDTPAELSGWAKAISRKLKLHKEPAKKAAIPIVGDGVRKKPPLHLLWVLGANMHRKLSLQDPGFLLNSSFLLCLHGVNFNYS